MECPSCNLDGRREVSRSGGDPVLCLSYELFVRRLDDVVKLGTGELAWVSVSAVLDMEELLPGPPSASLPLSGLKMEFCSMTHLAIWG